MLLKKIDWMLSFKNDLVARERDLYYELCKKKCEREKLKKYESHIEEKGKHSLTECKCEKWFRTYLSGDVTNIYRHISQK